MRSPSLILALSVAQISGFGSGTEARDVARKVDEYMKAGVNLAKFSSVVLVAHNGKVVVSKGYGMSDYEAGVALTPQTKFRIASLTKQFTGVSILMLQERGKLKVGDPICKYMAKCPPAWEAITIHQLLTHTSGIPNFTAFPEYRETRTKPSTVFHLIARVWDKPLDFTPGERFSYSNSGYALLGNIIERASGKSYQAFLQENIFDPLKMTSSGYDPTNGILKQTANGYERVDGRWFKVDQVHLSVSYAAGGIYSTLEDLYRWTQALANGTLIAADSRAAMFRPVRNHYGYGFEVRSQFEREYISHSGSIDGYVTFLGMYPTDRLTIIVLSNLGTSPSPVIARDIAAMVFGKPYEIPYERKEITLDPAIYDRYVGEYERQPGRNFKVYKENGRLYLAYLGRPTVELFPETRNKFFIKTVDAQFSFIADSTRNVTHLLLHQDGEAIAVKKVK